MDRVLIRYGFKPGVNYLSLTVPDSTHTFHAWSHRYPGMLRFLFGHG